MTIAVLALAIILVAVIFRLHIINHTLYTLIRDYDRSFFVLGKLISKLHPDDVQFRFCDVFWEANGRITVEKNRNGKIIITSAVHVEK